MLPLGDGRGNCGKEQSAISNGKHPLRISRN